MRRQRLSRNHFHLIVPLALLLFSARLSWTQERTSANKIPTQRSISDARFIAIPEAGKLNSVYGKCKLPFAPDEGQTRSLVRFRTLDFGYPLSLTKNNPLPDLWQLAKVAERQVKANHFIGAAPTEWLTDAIPHDTAHYRSLDLGDEVQYYGNRIPLAGRIILGIGKQAKFHPRVFRLFELIDPGLSLGNPAHPRSIGK
jgi:hypothetical protein